MAKLPFHKYEGLGNDFVLVEASHEDLVIAARAVELCDRRFGIGADGVLLVLAPRTPDCEARMRVLNADGSVPEMCGNGVRCVALHLAHARSRAEGTVCIDTDAGPRRCVVDDRDGRGLVTVDMGVVRTFGDRTLDVDGKRVTVSTADAGNPHAVLFGAFARGDVEHLGPRIAAHAEFPRGTNVEFACAVGGGIDLVVWERGVGITLACGTGACAAAAVACDKGLARRGTPASVRLPGGTLDVTISASTGHADEPMRATLRGPARYVYSGSI